MIWVLLIPSSSSPAIPHWTSTYWLHSVPQTGRSLSPPLSLCLYLLQSIPYAGPSARAHFLLLLLANRYPSFRSQPKQSFVWGALLLDGPDTISSPITPEWFPPFSWALPPRSIYCTALKWLSHLPLSLAALAPWRVHYRNS